MKIQGISTLFPNRFVNGAEVEQKILESFDVPLTRQTIVVGKDPADSRPMGC